jgi:hypothetical protein
MRDIIDLGNLAFDVLISKYGELPESRVLFLYSITQSEPWQILGSNNMVHITASGIIKNFKDETLEEYHKQWTGLIEEAKIKESDAIRKSINQNKIQLKEGDIIEFGKSSGEWREINFNL